MSSLAAHLCIEMLSASLALCEGNPLVTNLSFENFSNIIKNCDDMETFSALLALCEEIHRSMVYFPRKGPVLQNLNVFFVNLNKLLDKQLSYLSFETP